MLAKRSLNVKIISLRNDIGYRIQDIAVTLNLGRDPLDRRQAFVFSVRFPFFYHGSYTQSLLLQIEFFYN